MIIMKTIPFDLEKAKAGATVVTRDGQKVIEWHHFKSADQSAYCIAAPIGVGGAPLTFTSQGRRFIATPTGQDLFLLVEPKLRPWKPEEVQLDAWYRKRNDGEWGRVSSTFISSGTRYIRLFTGMVGMTYHCPELLTDFEHSIDGGKTFHPCGVEE